MESICFLTKMSEKAKSQRKWEQAFTNSEGEFINFLTHLLVIATAISEALLPKKQILKWSWSGNNSFPAQTIGSHFVKIFLVQDFDFSELANVLHPSIHWFSN